MRILYCTSQFYLHGGIEKILAQKINYWIEQYQYDVILCTSEHQNRNFIYPLNSKNKHIDLEINYYREKSYFHPLNIIKSVQHFIKLKRLINKINPDIIISVNFTPEQYFIPFIAKKIPTIKEFHSSGVTITKPKSTLDKIRNQLFLLLNRYTVKVVLNQDEIKYYPFDNIKVIPNFIKIKKFDPTPKENIIIAAGRIAPVKQFDHLIEAWLMIAEEVPSWEVHLYGEGDKVLTQQLQFKIDQLKIPRIELKGNTNQLDKKMQGASIYAMTSLTECFPMVLLEAQQAGMVVISYDCPNGPRNIITNNENGLLVTNQNINRFSLELLTLINQPEIIQKMAINALESVEQFNEFVVMRQWNELLKKLR